MKYDINSKQHISFVFVSQAVADEYNRLKDLKRVKENISQYKSVLGTRHVHTKNNNYKYEL